MPQTILSIRMDDEIKKRFDSFCADAGMNATVAVNLFARAVLREAMQQLEEGLGTAHELIAVGDD